MSPIGVNMCRDFFTVLFNVGFFFCVSRSPGPRAQRTDGVGPSQQPDNVDVGKTGKNRKCSRVPCGGSAGARTMLDSGIVHVMATAASLGQIFGSRRGNLVCETSAVWPKHFVHALDRWMENVRFHAAQRYDRHFSNELYGRRDSKIGLRRSGRTRFSVITELTGAILCLCALVRSAWLPRTVWMCTTWNRVTGTNSAWPPATDTDGVNLLSPPTTWTSWNRNIYRNSFNRCPARPKSCRATAPPYNVTWANVFDTSILVFFDIIFSWKSY